MLNRFPLWKNLMVIFLIAITALYALPNLYGEDPAIQVSAKRGKEITESQLNQVRSVLEQQSIQFKSLRLEENQVLIRLMQDGDQLPAQTAIHNALGDDYNVALNLAPATPDWLKSIGGNPMKLGLDLRGGVHFLMEVDMDAAIGKVVEQMVTDFRSELRDEKIRYRSVRQRGDTVIISFRNQQDMDAGESLLESNHRDLLFQAVPNQELTLRASMTEQRLKETRDYAIQQNTTILRNRVSELGVAEPVVQRQGAERIVVELPGIQDTATAKEILGATATLEFRMVDDTADPAAAAAGRATPGGELYYDKTGRPLVLKKRVILTGDHIVDANSGFDEYSRPQVNIKLDAAGGSKMARSSGDNVGKLMATVFIEYKPTDRRDANGKPIFEKVETVINAATIQTKLGRNFRITGIDSMPEAHNLALLLRAGALIAPIQIVEERTVGPSMGEQNIEQGMQSIVIGLALVIAFMLFYYRKFGIIANLALVVNLVVIVGVMSLLPGATLTLPGIAGIVLTIGTAVDANVLIFERIRDELREGRTPQQAIHHGYANAFSSIADAQLTTFITALILYAVGTGPVQGFAVTTAIGLATSMFTAIVATRAVVNFLYGGKRLTKLSI